MHIEICDYSRALIYDYFQVLLKLRCFWETDRNIKISHTIFFKNVLGLPYFWETPTLSHDNSYIFYEGANSYEFVRDLYDFSKPQCRVGLGLGCIGHSYKCIHLGLFCHMVICIWFNRAVHVIMDYFPLLQKQKHACNVRNHYFD